MEQTFMHSDRYLENDHIQHCVPSNVSSGLSFLPVSFVYVNGSANVTQKTTKVLPTGEPLDGAKAYIDILSYFTTTNNTPDEVHDLGYTMLHKLFPEVRNIFMVMVDFRVSWSNSRKYKNIYHLASQRRHIPIITQRRDRSGYIRHDWQLQGGKSGYVATRLLMKHALGAGKCTRAEPD